MNGYMMTSLEVKNGYTAGSESSWQARVAIDTGNAPRFLNILAIEHCVDLYIANLLCLRP